MMAIIDGQVPQADDTPSPVRVVIKLTEVAQRKRLDGESREGDRLLDELRKVLPDAEMKPYFSEDEADETVRRAASAPPFDRYAAVETADRDVAVELAHTLRRRTLTTWTIEYEGTAFERFFSSLPEYEQAVLTAAVEHVLEVHGIDICSSEWGKPLGEGLYEFRVRKSLHAILADAGVEPPADIASIDRQVLLRVFCTFHGSKIVLLYSGYNKKNDPSEKRQQREISKARKSHKRWKQQQKT